MRPLAPYTVRPLRAATIRKARPLPQADAATEEVGPATREVRRIRAGNTRLIGRPLAYALARALSRRLTA